MEITVTKTSTGTNLSTIKANQYIHQLYIGYTMKEAKAKFTKLIKGL